MTKLQFCGIIFASSVFIFNEAAPQDGSQAKKDSAKVILIPDPGHGGSDRGAERGKGFTFRGENLSEGAYTYDVAKRVERLAKKREWNVELTIIRKQKDSIFDFNEDRIIKGSERIQFNVPWIHRIVIRGKEGLEQRIETSENAVAKYPNAIPIFISIHFDNIDSSCSGTRIFAPAGMENHPFTVLLKKRFIAAGFGFQKCGSGSMMVEGTDKYFLLREGKVVPRVIIELGNFNNATDRMRMLRYKGREKYAQIIIEAIEAYIQKR